MQHISLKIASFDSLFFTSDLHFDHKNVITFCNRPFPTVKDMNKSIITNWNKKVSTVNEKHIFILGDVFWFPTRHEIAKTLDKMDGEIYIIPGNHDNIDIFNGALQFMKSDSKRIHICEDIVHLDIVSPEGVMRFILSHYPLMTWPGRNRETKHLHGHVHTCECNQGLDCNLPYWNNMYDVGVDNNNFTPVSCQEIIEIFKKKEQLS